MYMKDSINILWENNQSNSKDIEIVLNYDYEIITVYPKHKKGNNHGK